MELNQENMKKISGGGISSTVLNAISRALDTLYELGRAAGSAVRRMVSRSYCPLD